MTRYNHLFSIAFPVITEDADPFSLTKITKGL